MSTQEKSNTPYRVLALKYRPQNFEELIGQEALVRTLKNAIETGRIAHAFMLTGVRGVGKTTTARIIAKALNYKGPDGTSGPTVGPTDDCQLCRAIAEDRHPDVIEMDAASRTGVDDIREILDGVRYAPTEARYKVYIIDEVHMLSKQAFNALLKTLEEPPPHVKFIFATTEIRKVPVTVLSRCQRFDLRRVDVETLTQHFKNICAKEGVTAEDEALAMITSAADGSVRDGLSLLDQAIALGGDTVSGAQVRDMLGLSDRSRTMDLLEHALQGNMPEALEIMDSLYQVGADPSILMQDLLDLVHALTKFRAVPDTVKIKQAMSEEDIARAQDMAGRVSMPSLGKAWQILLKGLSEVNMSANPQNAAEMVIIRLSYAADLPDPRELIKKLSEQGDLGGAPSAPSDNAPTQTAPQPAPVALQSVPSFGGGGGSSRSGFGGGASAAVASAPRAEPDVHLHLDTDAITRLKTYKLNTIEDIVAFLELADQIRLAGLTYSAVHLVQIDSSKPEIGRIDVNIKKEAPSYLAQQLTKALCDFHGKRWVVSVVDTKGQPTMAEKAHAAHEAAMAEVKESPLVRTVIDLFPEAEIVDINAVLDEF